MSGAPSTPAGDKSKPKSTTPEISTVDRSAELNAVSAEQTAAQTAARKDADKAARKEDRNPRKPVKEFGIGNLTLDEVSQALRLIPVTNTFLQDVVFVCIDCEAWEFDSQEVTEVGIAILDTSDLRHAQPGSLKSSEVYENILPKIKYAHYRPVEYALHGNKRHCPGCPEAFGFGTTTWIRLGDGAKILDRIFDDPARLAEATDFSTRFMFENRSIIFVAHGPGSDIGFMKTLGFDLTRVQNIAAHVDTEKVVVKNVGGLVTLLASVEIDPVNLHNAGNDAAYTLQAMIKAAVLEWAEPTSVAKRHEILTKPDEPPEEPPALNGAAVQNSDGAKPPPKTKQKRKPKQAEVFDPSIVAPVTWGGTAIPGDEIKIAIPFKAAKNAAFIQRDKLKAEKDAANAQKAAAKAALRAQNPNGAPPFIEVPSQPVRGVKTVSKKICRFFQAGECRFGDNCRYTHQVIDQTNLVASVSDLGLSPRSADVATSGAADLQSASSVRPANASYLNKSENIKELNSQVWKQNTTGDDSEESEVVFRGRKLGSTVLQATRHGGAIDSDSAIPYRW